MSNCNLLNPFDNSCILLSKHKAIAINFPEERHHAKEHWKYRSVTQNSFAWYHWYLYFTNTLSGTLTVILRIVALTFIVSSFMGSAHYTLFERFRQLVQNREESNNPTRNISNTGPNPMDLERVAFAWQWQLLSAIIGGIAGFLYYHYIGCASGSCLITGNPWISSAYGSLLGWLLVPKRKPKHKSGSERKDQ